MKAIFENHTTISELFTEGQFWIVKYGSINGDKEKAFRTEAEARQFIETL